MRLHKVEGPLSLIRVSLCQGLKILQLLYLAKAQGLTIVLITHDETVAKAADKVFFMEDGELNNANQ